MVVEECSSSLLAYVSKDMSNRIVVLGKNLLVHNNFLIIIELGYPG